MLASDLQNLLRAYIQREIAENNLSGLRMAELSGLTQPHISNFLNQKKGLSIDALDSILRALHIDVCDLLRKEAGLLVIDPLKLPMNSVSVPRARVSFIDNTVILVEGAMTLKMSSTV